jgi:hypothetical protein
VIFSLAKGGQIVFRLQAQLIGFAFLDFVSVAQPFVGLHVCLGIS